VDHRRPSPQEVWRAIDAYTRAAYSGALPSAVRDRLRTLRAVPDDEFYNCAVVESDRGTPLWRYRIRLGNQYYPHMRLVIEPRHEPPGYAFVVDTHDEHCSPPAGSREYRQFARLKELNRRVAGRIEAALAAAGVPTLRDGAVRSA